MPLLARDLFILMDSAIIRIYFRNSQPPIALTAAVPSSGTRGHYTNKFTEAGLDFFISGDGRGSDSTSSCGSSSKILT